ncbi:cyclic nucleotide-gated cation channel-like [Elysia marginata]|uniref:Cyclic nucleotide-gated cation channel-like n=1 Tax=Elysia marginata TaxID=1093978 RepID=A0AAV4I8J1_9GAST|nr:cyclic nucleotide-gated cation channel-like [Elysia marginata]
MSGRGNRRTADVRCKGYTNVFTLSKHDFEMAMTEYPDAQFLLKKRAKRLLRANARMEKKHKKVEAEEIIRTPPETPKMLQTVIQVMDPDSNLVKHLTPSIRRSQRVLRRPHSRSHSHRLSPSASQMQHLSPYRSHSYKHPDTATASKGSSADKSVSPDTADLKCVGFNAPNAEDPEQTGNIAKTGYCTDDEADEPVFDDTSDDVSLSEVLHDAGASSSFEDDNEDDNMKDSLDANEKDEQLLVAGEEESEDGRTVDNKSVHKIDECQCDGDDVNSLNVHKSFSQDGMAAPELFDRPDPKLDRHNKVEAEVTSGDSQDSGLPDAQRSGSRGKEVPKPRDCLKSPPLPSRPEPQMSSSFQSGPPLLFPKVSSTDGATRSTEHHLHPPCDDLSGTKKLTSLQQADSLENYTEPQTLFTSFDDDVNVAKKVLVQPSVAGFQGEKTRVLSVIGASTTSSLSDMDNTNLASSNTSTRVQKTAPPSLVLIASSSAASSPPASPLTGPSVSTHATGNRVRKLSVVTPPVSPVSPKNSSSHAWRVSVSSPVSASTSVVHLASVVSVNGSPQSISSNTFPERVITPVETIPIRALPPINALDGHAVGVGLKAGTGLGGKDIHDSSGNVGGSECGGNLGSMKILEPALLTSRLPNGLESRKAATGSLLVQNMAVQDNRGELQKTTPPAIRQETGHSNIIPAQNRVTCAVEIHRQRSVTPVGGGGGAGAAQGGHKETML